VPITKAKRQTIGDNPLDEVVPKMGALVRPKRPSPGPVEPQAQEPPRALRQRLTVHVSTALVDEVRDAVVSLSGPPLRLTLAAFAENALRRELERLKKAENNGKPFPRLGEKLRGGRPIGS